ncbi:MAG: hypothetical protein ABFD10_07990, partial [Prolixibacteraceae bacterium]
KVADKYGNSDDKRNMARLEKELEKTIASKDSDLLQSRIDETDIFYFSILHKLPEYWVYRFQHLRDHRKNEIKDTQRADELISYGERSIRINDVETLKAVVRGLGELLPIGQQGDIKFYPERPQ